MLEDDVLELLDVPAHICEDLEAVGEDANFVEVANLNLVHGRVAGARSVHPVELITDALVVELFDDTHGFHTDGALSLLCAGAAVVRTVHTRVCSESMLPVMLLFDSWLAGVDIRAHPEVRASLKLSQKCLLVNNVTT